MGSADFKSVARHPAVSMVGSTPMRSRHHLSQHPLIGDAAGCFLSVHVFHQSQRILATGMEQVADLGYRYLAPGF